MFIPADAGNTIYKRVIYATQPVYPRWRGEHFVVLDTTGSALGLSPLARGTLSNKIVIGRVKRFIPAGAGNTGLITIGTISPAVYPRWRGEHLCSVAIQLNISGLSPLARGTLRL